MTNYGHYISLSKPGDGLAQIKECGFHAGVKGVQVRKQWRKIEVGKHEYDLVAIDCELAECKRLGLKYLLLVEDKTFDGTNPVPNDLLSAENLNGGYTAIRWHPEVQARYIQLHKVLADHYDGDDAFAGICIQESAPGLSQELLDKFAYSISSYYDSLLAVSHQLKSAFPRSDVLHYLNFLPGGMERLVMLAKYESEYGVLIGGPDLLPGDETLEPNLYNALRNLSGGKFLCAQNNSYYHGWPLQYLFRYATGTNVEADELGVDTYLIWNHTVTSKDGSPTWVDALPVIRENHRFGRSAVEPERRTITRVET